jgi:YfiH family protein
VDGDPTDLARRRTALADPPWTWLRQVHGGRVVTVGRPGDAAGEEADGAVTAVSGAVLAVHTADCGPVALIADGGAVAVAHAGWRGLVAEVVPTAVGRLAHAGPGPVRAVVGPLIGPECYEFGSDDLRVLSQRLGTTVAARTASGAPALDLRAAIRSALAGAGVEQVDFVGGCTACGADAFSHRARGDRGRQALLVWIDGEG